MISYHSTQDRSLPPAGKAIRRIREKALVPRESALSLNEIFCFEIRFFCIYLHRYSGLFLSNSPCYVFQMRIPSPRGRGRPECIPAEYPPHYPPRRAVEQFDSVAGAGCGRVYLGGQLRRTESVGRQFRPAFPALGQPDSGDRSHGRRLPLGADQLRRRPLRHARPADRNACRIPAGL